MAIDAIDTSDRLSGGGAVSNSATGESQSASFGGGILPSLKVSYSFGTGDGQVSKWYLAKRTLLATSYDDLDLTSALAAIGVTQAFTKLKRVFVGIIGADGTKKLRIGPQGRTSANQLWFQDVTTNFWEETFTYVLKDRPYTGWAITSGSADVLSVYNPTAGSIDYAIWLLGN